MQLSSVNNLDQLRATNLKKLDKRGLRQIEVEETDCGDGMKDDDDDVVLL